MDNNYGQNDNMAAGNWQEGIENARLANGGGNPWIAYGYDPGSLDQYGNPIYPGEPLRRALNTLPLQIGQDGLTPWVAAGYGGAAGTPGADGRVPVNYVEDIGPGRSAMAGSYTSTGYIDASGNEVPYNQGTYTNGASLPGSATGTSMPGGGGGGGGVPTQAGVNTALLGAAQQAAYQAYLNARLREVEIPQMQAQSEVARRNAAVAEAQQAFNEVLGRANLSGYNPVATNWAAQAVGNYERNGRNGPAAWQAAVPGLTDAEAQEVSNRMGALYQQTRASATEEQARNIVAAVTGGRLGTPSQTPTLAREQYETGAALNYLGMINDLKKRNPFEYLTTLTNTPQSIRDILNRAVSRIGVPGGTAQAAGLGLDSSGMFGPGQTANATGAIPDAGGSALPKGSQWVAKDWMNSSPYLKRLMLQGYEADNQNPDEVLNDYQKSLPQYSAATSARYAQA